MSDPKGATSFQVDVHTAEYFEKHFGGVMPTAAWFLDAFPDLLEETLNEIDDGFREDQLNLINEKLGVLHKGTPSGRHVEEILPKMSASIQGILKGLPLFSRFAMEYSWLRGEGLIRVDRTKGTKRKYTPSSPISDFYGGNFKHSTAAYSYLVEKFPEFYASALEKTPKKALEAYADALELLGTPNPGMLGRALGPLQAMLGIECMPVFTQACIEIESGIYADDPSGTMLTNSRIRSSTLQSLAKAFNCSNKLASEIILNAAPALIEASVRKPIDILGTNAARALLSVRYEMYGKRGVGGIFGESLKRACRYIPEETLKAVNLNRDSIVRTLEKMSPFELFCLESLSEEYLSKELGVRKKK